MAAISGDGASWDRVGIVLEPQVDELTVNEPWVVLVRRRFYMFYVSADREMSTIQMATSDDGIDWQRRGSVLGRATQPRIMRSPCVIRLTDRRFRLCYAARPRTQVGVGAGERLWCTELPTL